MSSMGRKSFEDFLKSKDFTIPELEPTEEVEKEPEKEEEPVDTTEKAKPGTVLSMDDFIEKQKKKHGK